jgi:hypothetical protein
VITIVCGLVHVLLEAKGLNESQKIIGILVSGWSVNMKIEVSGDQ